MMADIKLRNDGFFLTFRFLFHHDEPEDSGQIPEDLGAVPVEPAVLVLVLQNRGITR